MERQILQARMKLAKAMTKRITLNTKFTTARPSNEALEAFRANRTKKAVDISAKKRRRKKQVTVMAPSLSYSLPTKLTLRKFNMELGRRRLQRNKSGKRSPIKRTELFLKMREDLLRIGKTQRRKGKREVMKPQPMLNKNEHVKNLTSRRSIQRTGIKRRRAWFGSPNRISGKAGVPRASLADPIFRAPRGHDNMIAKIAGLDRSKTSAPEPDKARDRAHIVVAKSLNKARNRNIMKRISR